MNSSPEFSLPIESKEDLPVPDKVIIYVFRHGRCEGWETDKWKDNGGIWDPDMLDITDDAIEKVEKSAQVASKLVDPKKQIAVVLSSPRARTKSTSNIVGGALRRTGIEFLHDYGNFAPAQMAQFLRSRGDFSNFYDPRTGRDMSDDIHRGSVTNEVFLQRESGNTGWRMLEFLNYCATFFPEYYKDKPEMDIYKGKQPVLFLFTHNEVVANMLQELKLVKDFDPKKGTLPPGDFFELVCDLKNPGHFTIEFPDPDYKHEPADFFIDPKTGEAKSAEGEFVFKTGSKTQIEDNTARDGRTYL